MRMRTFMLILALFALPLSAQASPLNDAIQKRYETTFRPTSSRS